jgi:hypothetical protein
MRQHRQHVSYVSRGRLPVGVLQLLYRVAAAWRLCVLSKRVRETGYETEDEQKFPHNILQYSSERIATTLE